MIYKYLNYNFLKYIIYTLIICIFLLADLYLNLDFKMLILGMLIVMSGDIVFGIYKYVKLEKEVKSLKNGKFNISNLEDDIYKELIILNIKRLTDEYLIQMKNVKKEKEEYDEYIELWVHEIKIELANLTKMLENCDDNYILSELENLNDLIERILAIKNSENISINNNFQTTKLSYICNLAIKSQMNNLLANNIKIKTDYADDEEVIDRYWIIFIIKQLLNNSIKYGASEIKVICKNKKIIISDNGVGIDENELELVFQKFYCSTKTKENIKSTGIGLYLVRKILNNFGFTITLKNNNLGGVDAIVDLNKV